jgi:hypothetical protein
LNKINIKINIINILLPNKYNYNLYIHYKLAINKLDMNNSKEDVPRFVEKHERYIEIYKITNTENNKIYVGQTVSHMLNHDKYRRYGIHKRLDSHFSEAIKNNKDKECLYLNNAIRKYGNDKFIVELITTCDMENGDDTEDKYILECNSLFPNGYNLKLGKTIYKYTEETRPIQLDSNNKPCETNSIEQNKLERFDDVDIPEDLSTNSDKYIRVSNAKNKNLVILKIDDIEISFGSKKISKDKLKENLLIFIQKLIKYKKELESVAKLLDVRETPHSNDNFAENNNNQEQNEHIVSNNEIQKSNKQYNSYLKSKKNKRKFNFICRKCNVQKEKKDFRGYSHTCRPCEIILNKERDIKRKLQDKDNYNAKRREYKNKNKDKYNAKRREITRQKKLLAETTKNNISIN